MQAKPVNEISPADGCKRLLLYAHYDCDGKVDPHVLYQIRALHEFGMNIIFISNSPVSQEDEEKLSPFIEELRLRPDEGYDWTAWKEVLQEKKDSDLNQYDECILMNDSCYGPFFPLQEMFDKMAEADVDFWGISQNTDASFPVHLQPYFCVFRSRLFLSTEFTQFWATLPPISTPKEAINFGELRMTRFFMRYGYHYAVYADCEFQKKYYDPSLGFEEPFVYTAAHWLVRFYRAPFAKIKSFRTQYGKVFNLGKELFDALESSGSPYPTHLIADHIRRTRPLSWHKNLPGTLCALDTHAPVLPDPGLNIAVFAHLFYPDQVAESLTWLQHIPYPFDLYVSTSSEEKAAHIHACLKESDLKSLRHSETRVLEDRGRDVAPWILNFRDVHDNYDLALKFHIKKSPHLYPLTTKTWNLFLMRSVLASPGYVSSLIRLFTDEEKLGLAFHIFPPNVLLGPCPVLTLLGKELTTQWRHTLFDRLALRVPKETSWPLIVNNLFWYRPKAMAPLLHSNLSLEDFPPEPFPTEGTIAHALERVLPYIAQSEGYQYRQVLPSDSLTSLFQHYEDFFLNTRKESIGRWREEPISQI